MVGVLILHEDLRGHELDGSGKGGGLFVTVVLGNDFSYSEITNLDFAFVNEYVFGLYVSVDNAVLL